MEHTVDTCKYSHTIWYHDQTKNGIVEQRENREKKIMARPRDIVDRLFSLNAYRHFHWYFPYIANRW